MKLDSIPTVEVPTINEYIDKFGQKEEEKVLNFFRYVKHNTNIYWVA